MAIYRRVRVIGYLLFNLLTCKPQICVQDFMFHRHSIPRMRKNSLASIAIISKFKKIKTCFKTYFSFLKKQNFFLTIHNIKFMSIVYVYLCILIDLKTLDRSHIKIQNSYNNHLFKK